MTVPRTIPPLPRPTPTPIPTRATLARPTLPRPSPPRRPPDGLVGDPPVSVSVSVSATLRHYAAAGLLHTLDAYLSGRLPLSRLSWELRVRTDQLAGVDGRAIPACSLTRLRWLAGALECLQTRLTGQGHRDATGDATDDATGDATDDERARLAATVVALRVLVTSLMPDPVDPSGAGRRAPARGGALRRVG